jgi:hypothetical protein
MSARQGSPGPAQTRATGQPRHATLDVGDIDGDGLPDIVAGTFATDEKAAPWVDVWLTRKGAR